MRRFLIVLFLFGAVINAVLSLPAGKLPPEKREPLPDNVYNPDYCLAMTPAREAELNSIVTKLSDLLYDLASEYDDLDIRLVKLVVESHSKDEGEDLKDTHVQLVVNDCAFIEDNGVIEPYRKADSEDTSSNGNETQIQAPLNTAPASEVTTDNERTIQSTNTEVDTTNSNYFRDSLNIDQVYIVENPNDPRGYSYVQAPGGHPDLYWLDLDPVGRQAMELYREKHGTKPMLMYVRKDRNCDVQHLLFD